jgi:hypothetical protein
MKRFVVLVVMVSAGAFVLSLTGSFAWAGQQGQKHGGKATVQLPPAVAQAIKDNCPGAVIDKIEVEKEAGISLYDIEFKAGRGEIEVAEDGTVMDIATIVAVSELPKLAAEAIQKAAEGATVRQIEKSEVRTEIDKTGEKGTLVKLAPPKYVYEAELVRGEQRGEIQVAPDGQVVEAPKWKAVMTKSREEGDEKEEAEEKEEKEEAKPAVVNLKILPPAVLNAFKTAYPRAVIRGTSKETEKGVTYYEVESIDGKMHRDLLYTADGKAVEIEEAINPGSLPAAVTQALARAHPGYEVLRAEAMAKDGQNLFEIQIRVEGKRMSVTVSPDGKIIR